MTQDLMVGRLMTSAPVESSLFRQILEAMIEALFIVDLKGTIVLVNPAACDLYGYRPDELLGRSGRDLIISDCYDLFAEAKDKGILHGQFIGDSINRRRDGERLEVEIRARIFRFGEEPHLLISIVENADRKRKENDISRLTNQYTTLINTVPAIMYIKDQDHRYLEVNDAFCRIVGKKRREIIGQTDDDPGRLFETEGNDRADMAVMASDKSQINREQKITDAAGGNKWISCTKVPLHDENGKVTGMVGLIQDVTEHHLSRERLLQADKLAAIGTLAAGVAHEINNPMGYISSNLNTMSKYLQKIRETMLDGNVAGPADLKNTTEMLTDFQDAISESLEGAGRVKKIVADLKNFSRVDRAEKELANINEGLESTLNIVWNELKYKCMVNRELGELPDLFCIPNQLNQVFMNLLVNAGHAITEKGTITIKSWADEQNIHVSIRDTGQGIPEENLSRIFEPFYTTKAIGQGTGLGLSLAYEIIEKHHGRIDVTSEVGVGTEFVIKLPRSGIDECPQDASDRG